MFNKYKNAVKLVAIDINSSVSNNISNFGYIRLINIFSQTTLFLSQNISKVISIFFLGINFIVESFNSLSLKLQELKNNTKTLSELVVNNADNKNAAEIEQTVEVICDDVEIIRTSCDSLSNALTQSDKFIDNFTSLYTLFQDFLSILTSNQLEAFIHLSFISVLFILIYNLALIFYGESLIKYFNLVDRYPKLAKFINYRSKFQQYYFGLNLILISIILLILTFVNFVILFNL